MCGHLNHIFKMSVYFTSHKSNRSSRNLHTYVATTHGHKIPFFPLITQQLLLFSMMMMLFLSFPWFFIVTLGNVLLPFAR